MRVALGQDQRLAAGRGATVEDSFHLLVEILALRTGQLGHQLRALILNAHAALAEGFGRDYVAGDDSACGGEHFAGFEHNAGCAEFGFDGWAG